MDCACNPITTIWKKIGHFTGQGMKCDLWGIIIVILRDSCRFIMGERIWDIFQKGSPCLLKIHTEVFTNTMGRNRQMQICFWYLESDQVSIVSLRWQVRQPLQLGGLWDGSTRILQADYRSEVCGRALSFSADKGAGAGGPGSQLCHPLVSLHVLQPQAGCH